MVGMLVTMKNVLGRTGWCALVSGKTDWIERRVDGRRSARPTASEYIVHHLQHLQNVKVTKIVDFRSSTMTPRGGGPAWSAGGVMCCLWLRAKPVPGCRAFQAAVEILVEAVDRPGANIPQRRAKFTPLGLTVFVWDFS